jgi:pimeloyl-ACP methyl ester carboxylesterase
VGIGHSIGATMLLALAGGRVWMRADGPLDIPPEERLERLALMAPATGFFRAPGALDRVRARILVWAGARDTITPPSHAELLVHDIGARVAVDLRIVDGAGHFSFMHVPPPQTLEPLGDHDAFLAELTSEICRFA